MSDISQRKAELLTRLGIKPADIAALQQGSAELGQVMQDRIKESINDPSDNTQCAIVCQNIKMDGVSYDTLDPEVYFERIRELEARGGSFYKAQAASAQSGSSQSGPAMSGPVLAGPAQSGPIPGATPVSELPKDAIFFSLYPHPILRFIARGVDEILCLFIVNMAYILLAKSDPYTMMLTSTSWLYLVYFLMLLLEPLVISWLGTTPGKLIFGIRITNRDGSHLSLKASYLRMLRLWRYGFGFLIPIYNLVRMGMSYSACSRNLPLPWDQGILIKSQKPDVTLRTFLAIGTIVVISIVDTFVSNVARMPSNKGSLTPDQFYENCAHLYHYDSIKVTDPVEYQLSLDSSGHVNGLTFELSLSDESTIYDRYTDMVVAFRALVGVDPAASFLSLNYGHVMDSFSNGLTDFSFSYAGYTITNSVDYQGYARNIIYGYLYQTGEDVHNFHQIFTIKKGQ